MRSRSRWLAATLAGSLALAGPAAAAPVQREDVAEKAAVHFDRGEYREAAAAYAEYYRLLGDKRTSSVGENAVLVATDARRRAFETTQDRGELTLARDLLRDHLDAFERATGSRTGKGADRAAEELARIEAALSESEPAPAPAEPTPSTPTPGEPAAEEPTTAPEEPARRAEPPPPARTEPAGPALDRDAAPRRDVPGIALTAAGATLLAGGASLLVVGATLPSRAGSRYDDFIADDGRTSLSRDAYVQEARDVGNPLVIAGGIGAALGAGLLVYGIVRLVQHRRRGGQAALQWVPIPAGLAMMRRDPPAR